MTDIIETNKIDSADIITVGFEKYLSLRNRIKGLAMQKIILELMKNKKEDMSIKRIIEEICKKNKDEFFLIWNGFRIRKKSYSDKEYMFYKFDKRYEYLDFENLPDEIDIQVKEIIVNTKWMICNNDTCGQYILKDKKITEKCLVCRKGKFKQVKNTYGKYIDFCSGNKLDCIKKLIEKKYLKKINLSHRIDFFDYEDGNFIIYESKNKEKTGLTFSDLRSCLVYPIKLKKLGHKVEKLTIIYNGHYTDKLREKVLGGVCKQYNFDVQFRTIRNYLISKNIHIKEVIVTFENGKYNYELIHGISDRMKIIIKSVNPDVLKKEEILELLENKSQTTQQIAEEISYELSSTLKLLKNLEKAGKIEFFQIHIIKYWKLKQQKKANRITNPQETTE